MANGSGTAVRALVCDGDPGICDPLSCDYPRCADNPSIDDGEVHANSGSCLEYSSWGIKASRSRTSTVSHYIGNHNARDDLQKFCTYDSSCNVLCQIDIQDFILEETWGITSDGCHVFRGVVESRDGVNGGIASQGASCTGVAGAAVRARLFCQCAVEVRIIGVGVSATDAIWTYAHNLTDSCVHPTDCQANPSACDPGDEQVGLAWGLFVANFRWAEKSAPSAVHRPSWLMSPEMALICPMQQGE